MLRSGRALGGELAGELAGLAMPRSDDWRIAVGDVLGLTGSHAAVERALALLSGETGDDPSSSY